VLLLRAIMEGSENLISFQRGCIRLLCEKIRGEN
jgi:hypothetical protein